MSNFGQMFLERVNDMEKEVWKIYPDYPFIEASNLGRIRTKDRYVPNGKNSKRLVKGHIVKQYLNKCGYMYVSLTVNGKTINLRVHRVVATCFLPNPDNLPEVNHIDCDPTNNKLENLEWCTSKYNSVYRDKLGHGVNNNPGRPVYAVNLKNGRVLRFESQHEAGRRLNINQGNISNVLKGRQNQTGDYWFCYADENAVEKTREKFGDKIAEKVERLMRES